MTAVFSRDSRLRRTIRSMPVVAPLLRSASLSYYRCRREIKDGWRELGEKRLRDAVDRSAAAVGRALSAQGLRLLLVPYRRDTVLLPEPLELDSYRFDVAADLVEYTGLPRETVDALLLRRIENFRTEWLQAPSELRPDTWFYRSSRMYLFGNASHFQTERTLIDELAGLLEPGAHVLDFGGGTGNLALALAARGFGVDYHELSALQKDFVRFRLQRQGLGERVAILDSWMPLPPGRYGAVCAFDVLEHIPDLPAAVAEIAASLAGGGRLIEATPFAVDLANPMHHEDPGLETLLAGHGLALERTLPHFRVWAKRSA